MRVERLARIAASWIARNGLLLGGLGLAVRFAAPAGQKADPLRPEEDSGDSGRGRPVTPPSVIARGAGHETDDADAALLARLVVALAAGVLVMIGAMLAFQHFVAGAWQHAQPPLTAEQTAPQPPPPPTLQADPVGDLARLRTRETQALENYGWADAAHTRGKIPIERAMALSVGRALDPAP